MNNREKKQAKSGIWRAKEKPKQHPKKKYRPIVTVEKQKNGKPTIIKVSGNYYTLMQYSPDHHYGGKKHDHKSTT